MSYISPLITTCVILSNKQLNPRFRNAVLQFIIIICLQVVDANRLWQECVNLILREAANRVEHPDNRSNRQIGHIRVCIFCGISLGRRSGMRCHRLLERRIERNHIEKQIFPQQVPTYLHHIQLIFLFTVVECLRNNMIFIFRFLMKHGHAMHAGCKLNRTLMCL